MGLGWLGSIGGSLISGLFGMKSASDANSAQQAMSEQQHKWNVEDYQHRYQWAAQDMRAAGLNPILAATNGIGGSINGTSVPAAHMAPTPDFAGAFNSAFQTQSQKEIAKMQNEVAKEGLVLEKTKISNAKEKQDNDIKIDNARFALEKMVQEAAVKRADALNSAQIENMKERLKADIAHYERMDLNGAAMASAAMQSANAHGLMAAVQAELGISREDVMKAQEAYIGIQSENAEEALKWQKWLNDHPYTRGAVGFLGAIFDTAGLAAKIGKPLYSAVSSGGSDTGFTYSDDDYASWIK